MHLIGSEVPVKQANRPIVVSVGLCHRYWQFTFVQCTRATEKKVIEPSAIDCSKKERILESDALSSLKTCLINEDRLNYGITCLVHLSLT